MKPWQYAHTVAVLWMLVGIMLVLLVSGWVSEYRARLDWGQTYTPTGVSHPGESWCHRKDRGAWCP